ncbi:hypothetical protein MTBPR1_80106 [Candidatus Terasakiella magnetica]|uniref:Uncharacterized protein n=1 Tax=Candidatus Terasakiella magnetica TaxID=1867952 RepID=A0A1C3RL66_9PROT|nr:hypothetical protein [Candidatus Terasakiella magnetica]SCA58052.1 hypothetical protein MTBPR1_80106 [Candidatus Terasakiella magnetica]
MLEKIKCGDGEHCLRCKFYETLTKIGKLAGFSKNQKDRCDWFSEKDKTSTQ